MSWRIVVVSSNAKVDYKMDYLVVRTLNEVKRVHLSEIGVLILESTAISVTSYLLCELLQRKIKVIFCDHERNPCGELVPTHGCKQYHGDSSKQETGPRIDPDAGSNGKAVLENGICNG